jgi:hypothetical protein
MIEGRDTLKIGLIRRIGNGTTTKIWEDTWLPREENMRPYGCRVANPPTLVSELIDGANATWNKARVEEVFLPMDARTIMSIPLCTRAMTDFWSWQFEKQGVFTVKSAYNMLVATRQRREAWLEGSPGSSRTNMEAGSWKLLWKVQVPAKIRMFLWRLSKHSLPTEDVRAHRHMSDSPSCGLCGSPDSWRHSLVSCTTSRCTWALVDDELAQSLISTSEPSAKQWLFTLQEVLPHEKFVLLSVTLWAIWTARRKAIHEGIFQTPQATFSFVRRFIEELEAIREPIPVQQPTASRNNTRQRSKAPPQGFAKIHVDAGVLKGRGGSAAAICRDMNGTYLGSLALIIEGVDDPATLESMACREGLALAQDLNIQNFVIACDSKQVVSDIARGNRGRYGAIIEEINLTSALLYCNFVFESRAANYEAHSLAKFSLRRGPGRHVWYGQPHDPNRIPLSVDFE